MMINIEKEIKKIGITGSFGFIGTHLKNYLNLFRDKYEVIHFERSWFDDSAAVDHFVKNCDVIVHLAALNRHNDAEVIYNTNTGLVNKLIASLERTGCNPQILFSSSTHEERDNLYGQSKKVGREQLAAWAEKNGAVFTGMIIPNIFGPFGHPYYNSVVATFCHQLANNETPIVEVDGEIKLIYVLDLVQEMLSVIDRGGHNSEYYVSHRHTIGVLELLAKLEYYRDTYQDKGQIPMLENTFDYQLFNTYRCYMDLANYYPRKYIQHRDNRGAFTELIRADVSGQSSFSTTVPGITRGNHFHTRKIERFSVIKGKALIQLRRVGTDKVFEFLLDGDSPSYVDMPIWFTHNITNIGDDTLYTYFWINEPFDPANPDTYIEKI
jgi:UDP-2-acetamido-2,6-beta-L-arabino-hexul-4-ose reductase